MMAVESLFSLPFSSTHDSIDTPVIRQRYKAEPEQQMPHKRVATVCQRHVPAVLRNLQDPKRRLEYAVAVALPA
jgi:hypothetical protein